MKPLLIGYARVSKSDESQVLDYQIDALIAGGVLRERIYTDRASGRREDRPGLEECLKALQPGNVLVVWKLDRLGRSVSHLIALVDEFRARGIGLNVLTGRGAAIDTSTTEGRLMFGLFAILAEFEVDINRERTQAGLAAARARGRLGGRPRKMEAHTIKMAAKALKDQSISSGEVAKTLGVATSTLYTYVNGDGSLKARGRAIVQPEMMRDRP